MFASPQNKPLRNRLRITPSFVLSTLALVVVTSGVGYAAGSLPRHSVGTQHLKANAVTSAKVKNGSLTANDFAPGVLADAGAVGWVLVDPNGLIGTTHGGTLATPTVTHPVTGVYCVIGDGWARPVGPYAVTIFNAGQGGHATVNPGFWANGACPQGNAVTVSTFNAAGALADSYFSFAKLG